MSKKRIMLVDDHKAATQLWRTLLEMTGAYVVQEENHGRRALETARNFHPDLIVLDVNMPELDGGEVAASISTDQRLKDTPILFMTSLVSEDEVAEGKRIEGFPCMAKPTSLENLIGNIEKHAAPKRRFQNQQSLGLAA